jgi:hypothetical protein
MTPSRKYFSREDLTRFRQGALFGVTDVRGAGIFYVDDASNTLNLFH